MAQDLSNACGLHASVGTSLSGLGYPVVRPKKKKGSIKLLRPIIDIKLQSWPTPNVCTHKLLPLAAMVCPFENWQEYKALERNLELLGSY